MKLLAVILVGIILYVMATGDKIFVVEWQCPLPMSREQYNAMQATVPLSMSWTSTCSNSMWPCMTCNEEYPTIKVDDTTNIIVGDIVAFRHSESVWDFNGRTIRNNLTVHRVVKITRDKNGLIYVTKGDNNFGYDPWIVRHSDIEGKVIGWLQE